MNAPLDSRLLPELIYQRLRLDILNGALRKGQVLRQEELAQSFQTSRVPLREALSKLEADGLIVQRPRRGYAVSSLDPDAIVEIFELRALVEAHAGAVAARARTKEDIAAVESILGRIEKLDASRADFYPQWFALNRDFHARIIASSHRSRVARLAANLLDSVEPYIRAEAEHRRTGHVRDADHEHREMLEAFRAGDAEGLGELSSRHVRSAARRLLGTLRRNAASNPTAPLPGRKGRRK
jgi:DNA-binding GntR family transcriptional regulator